MITLGGCRNNPIETISLGDWIKEINTKAGIHTFQQVKPYFLNITETSPYYSEIQSAVEWDIIDTNQQIDPETTLTREWVAYTLLNLSGIELTKENEMIKDLRKSSFPKHISTAISSGFMRLNQNQCFQPNKEIDEYEALKLLDEIVLYMNTKEFEHTDFQIEFEDIDIQEVEPIEEDIENHTLYVPNSSNLYKDDYIAYEDQNNNEHLYVIDEVHETKEHTELKVSEPNFEDIISSIDIEDSFEVDFMDAQVKDLIDHSYITSSSYTHPSSIRFMSMAPLNKSHDINGYHIEYHLTSSGFFAEVTKSGKFDSQMYASFLLNGLKPNVKWKMDKGKIEEGYFRVDFSTVEKLGVKSSYETEKYGDFTSFNINNLKGSFESLFKDKQNIDNITVPICEIQFPFPNMPVASLTVQLNLKIYVSGQVELVLSQDNCIGMEIRNGNMRTIQQVNNDAKATIKASSSILSNLLFGLKAGNYLLADIGLEGGANANLDSELHIYDEDNNHQVVKTDLPIDLVENATKGNGDILTCANLKAYWILRALLNSSNSAAGRMGLSATLNILDENNSTLIPGLSSHLENGMMVNKCTRGERDKYKQEKKELDSNLINLENYHLILKEGQAKKLVIKDIPTSYKYNDLQYSIKNSKIASIDQNGNVHGNEEGSTIITIKTKDNKYEMDCTVIVTKS